MEVRACILVRFIPCSNTLPQRVALSINGEHNRKVYSVHITEQFDFAPNNDPAKIMFFVDHYCKDIGIRWGEFASIARVNDDFIVTSK